MHRATSTTVALAVAFATVVSTRDAHAFGPVEIEVAVKAGYATNPLSTNDSPPNPLGFGLGGRAGIVFKGGLYLGGSVVDYFTGNTNETTTPSCTTSGTCTPASTTTPSTHVLMYGAEMGYGIKLVDLLTLRPQVGFGDATFSVSGQSQSTTYWYLEPGVVGLVDFGVLFVGADVNMLLVPSLPGTEAAQAAFTFHAQVGVKF